MGMTIEEAIEFGEKHYHTSLSSFETREERVEHIRKLGNYEHLVIDTMRKYKKIEQIYKEWFSDAGHTSAEAYRRIGEVLKDGKNDR